MAKFSCPTTVITGENALQALRELKAERVMVVTDSYFSGNGTAKRVGNMIPNAEVLVFDDVTPDPTVELAAAGAAACMRFRPQIIIALGGGSPMDCAKAILASVDEAPMLVAIPTTSGSGSEVTSFSILTKGKEKIPLVDVSMRPALAILDDSFLRELPPGLLADTGMDLIAHSLEAIAAKGRSAMTTALAETALSTALQTLAASYSGDLTMRRGLHEAACMAGIAFDNAGLGICHAMAHAMGAQLHLPHGRLCAMLLPHVLAVNLPAAEAQYRHAAAGCGLAAHTGSLAVRSLSSAIVRLRTQMNMPANLREAGVSCGLIREKQSQIVETALSDACCGSNPVPVSREMVLELLRKVAG